MVAAMLTEISDMLMAVGRDVQLINRQNPRPPRLARGCVSRYGGSGFLPIRRSETGDLLRGGCSRNQRSDGKPDAVPLCPTRIHLVFRLKSLCDLESVLPKVPVNREGERGRRRRSVHPSSPYTPGDHRLDRLQASAVVFSPTNTPSGLVTVPKGPPTQGGMTTGVSALLAREPAFCPPAGFREDNQFSQFCSQGPPFVRVIAR